MFANYFTEDLEPGWKLVGRKQDTADFEWKTWTPILMNWLQYSAIYLVFSQILKMYNHHYLSTFSIFISFLWLLNNIGLSLSVFIFVQPIILISILYFLSLSFVWATGVGFTLALHSSNFENAKVSFWHSFLLTLITYTFSHRISFSKGTWRENIYSLLFWPGLMPVLLASLLIPGILHFHGRNWKISFITAFTFLCYHQDHSCFTLTLKELYEYTKEENILSKV